MDFNILLSIFVTIKLSEKTLDKYDLPDPESPCINKGLLFKDRFHKKYKVDCLNKI